MTDEILERAEFAPTSVPARSRWLGPAVGVMVAIVSFGFGGSLSRGTPAEPAQPVVEIPSEPSPATVEKSPSVAVRFSGRGGALAVDVSIGSDPPVLRIDGLVDATIRAVEVRVSDPEGRIVATATVETRALSSVIAYNSNRNGVAALSATVALPSDVAPDQLMVEVIAR